MSPYTEVKSVIYLIGGPPRCGKTTLARRLAGAMHCSWIQTDYLEAAISRYLPGHDDRQNPKPAATAAGRYDILYATYSAAQGIAYDRARAQRIWPGVQALIAMAVSDGEDLVLEGFHIDPVLVDHVAAPTEAAGRRAVRCVFLVREDVENTVAGIRRPSRTNDWLLRGIQQDVTFERIMHMIVLYSKAIRADAERSHFPVVLVDGDFDRQIEYAMSVLQNTGTNSASAEPVMDRR